MDAAQYLEENGKKEGVTVLESGLQYRVVTSGDGATPTKTNSVETHYAGRLIDGTQFDSSYDRGEPLTFGVTQVIAGWTEALQLMKEGDKWELTIPADLAYGASGAGGTIGPNETLIFDIELLKVI
jgi:FKBP-type peptidyl-prolyl cis-trans isomerase FklB